MREVMYICDKCGKISSSPIGWYEVNRHVNRTLAIIYSKTNWHYCSRKCMREGSH